MHATTRRVATTLVAALAIALMAGTSAALAQAFPAGTMLVSTGNGRVTAFTPDGAMLGQLDTTTGSSKMTGGAFDAAGNFIVTDFSANNVSKFDPSGILIGPFGGGYNLDPESITFDQAGDVFVGQAYAGKFLEFSAAGALIQSFSPNIQFPGYGPGWIQLADDQCTMFYSEQKGFTIRRYNICTNSQMPDFASLPQGSYQFKIMPGGGLIIAAGTSVILLDGSGNLVQSFPVAGASGLYAVAVDPGAVSFWTADSHTGLIYQVSFCTGAVLGQRSVAAVSGFNGAFGLAIKGEGQQSQSAGTGDTLSVTHFDVNGGDGSIRIINPSTSADGLTCAMIYVFDAHEEMRECCGCPISNDGLRVLSTINDLTLNPLSGTPTSVKTGVVEILATPPNQASGTYAPCDPGLGSSLACTEEVLRRFDPALNAWSTHSYAGAGAGVTEEKFLAAPLNDANFNALTSTCAFIHLNGTGQGVCTCGRGDPKAPLP